MQGCIWLVTIRMMMILVVVSFLSCKLYNKFLLSFMHLKKLGEHSKIMHRIFLEFNVFDSADWALKNQKIYSSNTISKT